MTRSPAPTRSLLLAPVLALGLVALPVEPVVAEEIAPATRSATVEVTDELDPAPPSEPAETPTGAGPAAAEAAASSAAQTSETIAAPLPFVGLGVRGTGAAPDDIQVRTRSLEGSWSDWTEVPLLEDVDGPEPGSAEARRAADQQGHDFASDAVWAGPSDAVQLAVAGGDVADLELTFTDTAGLSESRIERVGRWLRARTTAAPAEAADGPPGVITRRQWGANESWRSGSPVAREVRFAVLHHTASSNDYSREQAAQQVRNIYHWHTQGNGWNDVGYNFLVDKYGRVYEGRAGGMDRGIQGAHVAGWNSGSFGVAVMGNYNDTRPGDHVIDATAELMAWKYATHGLDPDPTARVWVNGYSIRTLESHRNLRSGYVEGSTDWGFQRDCPGQRLYWLTPQLRDGIQKAHDPALTWRYRDVPDDHTFQGPIEWMAQRGLTDGFPDGTFRPSAPVTRQAMAAFLHRYAGRPATPGDSGFDDVGTDHPFREAIAWMRARGLTTGYRDGTFRPKAPVTRQSAAAFLARLEPGFAVAGVDSGFSDVPRDHAFHDEIAGMARHEVAQGYPDGSFGPKRRVTRQAAASFLAEFDARRR